MSETTFCTCLADIASRYHGFIIDQWGVLHDGGAPYPGAIACLTELKCAGKRIVLLTNSGKRAADNRLRIAEMGFEGALFDDIVTSGEASWQFLQDRADPLFAGLGNRCFLWSRGGDEGHIDGLELELAPDPEDADFLYLAGIEDYAELEPFIPALEAGAARDLPMICANPDIVAIYPNGGRGMAPGGVARHYEGLGGKVIYVGKPHRPVYDLCLKKLDGIARDEILGIGDSLAHDIAGGNNVGIDTALLLEGVHRDAFTPGHGPSANGIAMDHLAAEYRARPRWALPSFRWRAV
jgi:HAD superfamily hydrolase (TIGR01459 family)